MTEEFNVKGNIGDLAAEIGLAVQKINTQILLIAKQHTLMFYYSCNIIKDFEVF